LVFLFAILAARFFEAAAEIGQEVFVAGF